MTVFFINFSFFISMSSGYLCIYHGKEYILQPKADFMLAN